MIDSEIVLAYFFALLKNKLCATNTLLVLMHYFLRS
jgi:hypothetical protein